jgi:glycosyltransferase involved in cell wall biosynthesis
MRVLCLIDHIGHGGAQRQLCNIAVQLKRRGMDVSLLAYHHRDFCLSILQQEEIEYKCVESSTIPRRILAMRRELREGNQDVVLAFLPGAVLYSELATIPGRKWGLVVSERSAVPGSHHGFSRWRRAGHLLADYVTANSHTNRLMIERSVPALKGRVITVYNCIDFDSFSPGQAMPRADKNRVRLVVAAKFRALKNPVLLMEALALARKKEPSIRINLDWYGLLPDSSSPTEDIIAYNRVIEEIEKNGLQDCVKMQPAVLSIAGVYRGADAVISPSFYEGLSNVVCEAMACGRPILVSSVSDAGNQVRDGYNGYLFNPASAEDMADTILRFAVLPKSEKDAMGQRSREMAKAMFDPSMVAAKYAEILTAAAERKRVTVDHWIPVVPETAEASLD